MILKSTTADTSNKANLDEKINTDVHYEHDKFHFYMCSVCVNSNFILFFTAPHSIAILSGVHVFSIEKI